MESNSFRKLLLIFTAILLIPVMNAFYGIVSATVTGIIVLIAIIIILAHFTTRKGTKPKNRGICADIQSINIKVNGRSYIIKEGNYFNTEDHEQPGVMSYVENGVWFISDSPSETVKGSVAEITIPADFSLSSLDVAVNSGNILIDKITAMRCGINVYSDFAQINSLNTSELYASSGKGKLIINTRLNGNAELSCGSGELDVNIDGSFAGYNLTGTVGNGSISLNGSAFLDSTNRAGTINNDAPCTVKASCGLGHMSINFTEVSAND